MSRLNNTTLPDRTELSRILHTEAARSIPEENNAIHFPDFTVFMDLLEKYGEQTTIFDTDVHDIHQVVAEGAILLDQLVPKLLSDPSVALLNKTYDYLSEHDQPQKSDLIFVFGARTVLRAEKAAALYLQGLAERIMVSGGNPIYHSIGDKSEAERYADFLVQSNIPRNQIITEDQSITVPDNVRSSLNLLEKQYTLPASIIIVNSPYAQRRGWAILKKHLPPNVAIYRVNSDCAQEYRRENWYKQETTLRVVLNEFIKMRASVVYNTA